MEKKQVIITIGREFGSGGHEIAQKLADHYGLPLYDTNLLQEVLDSKGIHGDKLEKFDEKQKRFGVYRNVRGMESSPEVLVAHMQFDYLRDKAKSGESFVVVGRCAETVLKEYEATISIFILGDKEEKVNRVTRIYNLSPSEAEEMMKKKDEKRKRYHNSFCEGKWGDSRNYELSVNSSKLGVDRTMDILIEYIEARRQG